MAEFRLLLPDGTIKWVEGTSYHVFSPRGGDTDRAGNIIDRIRAHVKKAPPRKERFDLNVAINEMVALARSSINQYGVSVQTEAFGKTGSNPGGSGSTATSLDEPDPERS
jgi:hypothetical protein